MKIKIYIKTFGCKVNQYDSQLIKENLMNDRYIEIVKDYRDANLIIINSCFVTKTAEDEVIKTIKRLKNYAPVLVTGCYIENIKFDNVLYITISEKIKIKETIYKIFEIKDNFLKEINKISFFEGRTRAFLKIQEGCNKFCSYCIVPYLRGRARSKEIEIIKEEFLNLINSGYKEIVLTGTEIGFYGLDINSNLLELLKDLTKFPEDFRIRLSSIDPEFLNDDLIEFISNNEKICPHLHLPLQSGSDKILNLMRRGYSKNQYLDLINKLKEKIKNITFTTDIIVGFPNEDERDFNETLDVIEKVKFLKCHIFPFSERKGTYASKYFKDKKVDEMLIEERLKIIKDFAKDYSKKVIENFINKELIFLGETKKENKIFGFTDNYIRTFIEGNYEKNKFYKIYLQNSKNLVEYGIVISEFYYGVPIKKEVRICNASSL
jgi:threonylcarbamoyladenosine tRNA methylthiotransferase MtaB